MPTKMRHDLGAQLLRPPMFEHVRDLEAFEGAILSQLRAGTRTYVAKWCARDEQYHRVLAVQSDQRVISEYLAGRRSLRNILTEPNDDIGVLLDFRQGHIRRAFLVLVSSLPGEYLPEAGAFHDPELRPAWADVPQSFIFDSGWDASSISALERSYRDAFAFAYVTHVVKRLPEDILQYRLDSGYPYSRAFAKLRSMVPANSAPQSIGIAAASPGFLTISAPAAGAAIVAAALQRARRVETQKAYGVLHEWSRRSTQDADAIPQHARREVERLATLLGVPLQALLLKVDAESRFGARDAVANDSGQPYGVPDAAGGLVEHGRVQLLVAAKLVASYYRKLRKILHPGVGVEFLSPLLPFEPLHKEERWGNEHEGDVDSPLDEEAEDEDEGDEEDEEVNPGGS